MMASAKHKWMSEELYKLIMEGEDMMRIRDLDLSNKIYVVSYLLDDFDRFERKFYEWLDENMK